MSVAQRTMLAITIKKNPKKVSFSEKVLREAPIKECIRAGFWLIRRHRRLVIDADSLYEAGTVLVPFASATDNGVSLSGSYSGPA